MLVTSLRCTSPIVKVSERPDNRLVEYCGTFEFKKMRYIN